MTSNEIRKAFLDFFTSKGHQIVPSDSLVPANDPTLLFTGAGMNQFKEQFLGRNIAYRRAASSQKCLRTGDLERVGKTPGHHTFFEMLGNFSFGDYFKRDAICWAWEFLTEVLKLRPESLWASVYEQDDKAYGIWADAVKVPETRIKRCGPKENFWPSNAPAEGPNGPCGPCSEIFYDYGQRVGCGKPDCSPACDCGRFIEVWNLVFTQFDRQRDGSLKDLPSKNIDTGMGLERITAVVQQVRTNFETDSFRPIIDAIEKRSGAEFPGRRGKVNTIADHIRAITFAIADGVMPSNEERGYVIRKLIRRSCVYGADIGITKPLLYKLVSIVAEGMKEHYPVLIDKRDDIAQVVLQEEKNFSNMAAALLPKVNEALEKFTQEQKRDSKKLAEIVFNFYDTYGAPYDWIEDIAGTFNLEIDKDAFDSLLEKQRKLSRSKSKIRGEIFAVDELALIKDLGAATEFLGYDAVKAEGRVVAVFKDRTRVAQAGVGEKVQVVLDRTPFYAESGGQVGDKGRMMSKEADLEISDTKKAGDSVVHYGTVTKGVIRESDTVFAEVSRASRERIKRNHTATHLLHGALRKVLGPHVHQAGSVVDEARIRFDFTHVKKMEERELERVEDMVNGEIAKNVPVCKEVMDINAAMERGAMALFGEKYGTRVRVVVCGDSKELCGGTHADSSREIGLFTITGESSIAAGTRRIEALTGDAALEFMKTESKRLYDAYQRKVSSAKDMASDAELKKIKEIDTTVRVHTMSYRLDPQSVREYRACRETLERAAESVEKIAMRLSRESRRGAIAEKLKEIDALIAGAETIGASRVIARRIEEADLTVLRAMADAIRTKSESTVIVLGSRGEERVFLVCALTRDLVDKGKSAQNIIKEIANIVGGSGGGRPDFAQAGGKDPSKLEEALKKVPGVVKEELER